MYKSVDSRRWESFESHFCMTQHELSAGNECGSASSWAYEFSSTWVLHDHEIIGGLVAAMTPTLLQHSNFLIRLIIIFLLSKLCGLLYIQTMMYSHVRLPRHNWCSNIYQLPLFLVSVSQVEGAWSTTITSHPILLWNQTTWETYFK